MSRVMVLHETYADDGTEPVGALITQYPGEGAPERQFYVSREEAPVLIRMLADAFALDLMSEDLEEIDG